MRAIVADLSASSDVLRRLEGKAARVLVDAPCSGLGAIRRNPEARWRLRPGDLARLVEAQLKLASGAARLVAPHGRLVFATCSFLPSEGEHAFARLLAAAPELSLVTARDVLGRARSDGLASADGRFLQTWRFGASGAQRDAAGARASDSGPNGGIDGFFAAVARRARSPAGSDVRKP